MEELKEQNKILGSEIEDLKKKLQEQKERTDRICDMLFKLAKLDPGSSTASKALNIAVFTELMQIREDMEGTLPLYNMKGLQESVWDVHVSLGLIHDDMDDLKRDVANLQG